VTQLENANLEDREEVGKKTSNTVILFPHIKGERKESGGLRAWPKIGS
jgi:hypothetical protein